jgi:hypothetical protein
MGSVQLRSRGLGGAGRKRLTKDIEITVCSRLVTERGAVADMVGKTADLLRQQTALG